MATSEEGTQTALESQDLILEPVFEPDLDRKYFCPVCLSVLKEPMQTSCGHRFCKSCIHESAKLYKARFPAIAVHFTKCPVDNNFVNLNEELFPDNAMKREVLSLHVKCPNIQHGCNWRGELNNYNKKHKDKCEFTIVNCTNGCGSRLFRQGLPDHLPVCDFRVVCCPHCQVPLPYLHLPKHEVLMCQDFPVQCLLCGKIGIKRKDISIHLNKKNGDCPQTVIPCHFNAYGCDFTTKRMCMPNHLQEACHIHLSLAMNYIVGQDARVSRLEDEVDQLKRLLRGESDPDVDSENV